MSIHRTRAVCCAAFALLAACGGDSPARRSAAEAVGDPVAATDDNGRTVRLAGPARRVVSLVPSATETLLALGARERVVGRTRYDTDPRIADVPSVGGGLDPSVETLLSLRPDLVISWDAGKSPGLRERLEQAGIAVFEVETTDTADVFRNIERLGSLIGRRPASDSLAAAIRLDLRAVRAAVAGRRRPSVLYVVWSDPPTTAGPNTFITQVIGLAGGRTIFPDLRADWPQVSMEEIVRRQPELVLLPVGENRRHSLRRLLDAPGWRELEAVREGRIVEVPADLLSRPGPHLAQAARAMRAALHPDASR